MDPVRFRDCECPGTPHPEGDTVTLRPHLDFDASLEALQRIFDGAPDSRRAMKVYLLNGPESWNLVDEDGDPVPLTKEALEALPFADQYEIADAADTLYASEVISPLERRMRRSSEIGPTGEPRPIRPKASQKAQSAT